jgi:hypothetical protein
LFCQGAHAHTLFELRQLRGVVDAKTDLGHRHRGNRRGRAQGLLRLSALTKPWSMPASSESPAPTVLATLTFGGEACSAEPTLNQFTPSAPWEITTCSMP